jgi:hypothetical protein
MSPSDDLLSETNACDLLARLFRKRGYSIARNIPFREYGVSFHIDGWDSKARVGFEFLTSEDDDHDDLTLEEYKTLMDAQQRGEVALFIVDEVEPLSVADLTYTVNEFLDEVAEAAKAARKSRGATRAVKKAAKAKAGKKAKRISVAASSSKATGKPGKPKPTVTKKPVAKKQAKKAAVKRASKRSAKKSVKKANTKRSR